MHRKLSFGLALIISMGTYGLAQAEDPQTYAMDKLANAQAQLDRLEGQKGALNDLIKAVKKDLKAAKIRAKAERIQIEADTARQDAAVFVEQSGVAIDLPNLMNTRNVEAGIVEYKPDEKDIDLMFKDREKPSKAVFFPGNSAGKKVSPSNNYYGINNDSDIPDYIK
jgi:uncharacterized protein (UPF0335 family)